MAEHGLESRSSDFNPVYRSGLGQVSNDQILESDNQGLSHISPEPTFQTHFPPLLLMFFLPNDAVLLLV